MAEDLASLRVDVDATSAKQSKADLEAFAAAGARAEKATDALASAQAQAQKLIATYNTLLKSGTIEQEMYNAAVLRTKAGLGTVEAEYRSAIAELNKFKAAQQGATASAGQQRAGMQQLSFQIGDVAQQFALGAKPMTIFAQQGGQVIQALQMMTGSTKGLLGFLGGPWGAVLTGAAIIASTYVSKLLEADDATQKVEYSTTNLSDAQTILGNIYDINTGKAKKYTDATLALARAQSVSLQIEAQRAKMDAQKAMAELERPTIKIGGGPGGLAIGNYLGGQADVISAFRDGTLKVDEAERSLRSLNRTGLITDEVYEKASKAVTDFGVAQENIVRGDQLEKALGGDAKAMQGLLKVTKEHKAALTDAEKEYKRANEAAKAYIADLELDIAKIGLTDKATRLLEASRAADAAATQAQSNRIKELAAQRETELALQSGKDYAKKLADETAALGLNAVELKRRTSALEEAALAEAAMAAKTDEERRKLLDQALAIAANQDAWERRTDAVATQKKYLDAVASASDRVGKAAEDALKKEADAAERLNNQYRDMIGLLQNIGGLGSVLGGLLGIASGNYNAIGGGAVGDLLKVVLNQPTGKTTIDAAGNKIAEVFGDKLNDVFGKQGLFGQTLKENLQSIGLGVAGASAVLGQQRVGGQLGAAIGGVLGEEAGKAIGKSIGGLAKSLGGPIGAVLGGVLGGLVGGLFGKPPPPSGTATISNGTTSISGNDAQRKQVAGEMAGAVNDGLRAIASQLGTGIGDYLVSIGVYKDQYRVNFSGSDIHGKITNSAQGDRATYATEAEAVAAAIRDAVKDGAIKGLSAGAKALILATGDINEQVNKALKFDQVFKDVAAATNPFKAAMDDLGKQMTDLTAIFNEAGASAQDLATLQEWLVQKQQALIEQASASYRSTFYTTDQNVAYAKQTISSTLTPLGYGNVTTVEQYKALVEATDALANPELYGTLMNLSDEFAVLKDAAEQAAQTADAAAAAEKALAQQRASINIQILQAQGKTAEALAAQRAAELAAADESLRADLKRLYAAQDIATARDAVNEAYKREKSALEDTRDAADKAISSLKDYRDSLNGTGNAALTTRQAMLKLMQVGGSAAGTGADALTAAGQLPGAGNDYLSALKNSAGSYLEYARGEALVKQYTNRAIAAAEGQKSDAQRQIEQMTAQVNALGVNTEATVSLTDAIAKLNSLLSPSSPGTPSTPGGGQGGNHGGRDNHDRDEREQRRWDRQHASNTAMVEALGDLNNRLRNITSRDGTGINVRTDADLPLNVTT